MYLFAISWQSIIAGAITTLAISVVMAVLGVALGFTVVNPRSDHPTSGLGTAFGVWGVISVLVSLAAGGFAAGMFSAGKGAEHGFMVWALVLVVGALFSGVAVGTAVRTVGSIVRGIGSGAASVASTVGGTVGDTVSGWAHNAMDGVQRHVGLEFDADQLGDKVSETLRDTGVETLQPDYLKQKMREAKGDLRVMMHDIRTNSDNYQSVINDFLVKQKDRFASITNGVNKDAAVNALMKKRGITREEAREAVDNAVFAYQKAIDKAGEAIDDVQQQVQETKEHLAQAADQARISADHFASSMARSALAAAVALVLGAAVCMYAGYIGNRYSPEYVVTIDRAALLRAPVIGNQVLPTEFRRE